jgi:hypothetical protein
MNVDLALQEIKTTVERDFFPWVVDEVIIETPEQLKNSSDLLAIGKRLEKDATAQLALITKPLQEQEQAARDAFRPLISRIHLGWSRIDDAIIIYHRKIKTEADALLQLQMQEQAAKIAESKETGEVIEPEQVITVPVGQTVRGNMGTTSIKETPEFTIIDENAVERSLCSPDLKKIKARYASGIKEIPGVLITVKTHTVSRFS